MGRAAAGLDFRIDRPGDFVARQQIGGATVVTLVVVPAFGFFDSFRGLGFEEIGDVVEHESFVVGVLQRAAIAAHAFGDQDAAHAGRPDHARRMKLHELHVHQVGAGIRCHGDAIAGVFPRIRRDFPGFAAAAGGEHHGFALEHDELAALAPVAERAADAAAVGQ